MPWSELIIGYFREACRSTLGRLIGQSDFKEESNTELNSILYTSNAAYLMLGYWGEDAPAYQLTAEVGILDSSGGTSGLGRRGVGIWEVIADNRIVTELSSMTFHNREELEARLRWFRDVVLAGDFLTLLRDPDSLRRIVDEVTPRRDHAASTMRTAQTLNRAREAFDAGKFESAVREFTEFGEDALSPADAKRLAIARNRISHSA
jgi:hypothetical protein